MQTSVNFLFQQMRDGEPWGFIIEAETKAEARVAYEKARDSNQWRKVFGDEPYLIAGMLPTKTYDPSALRN